MRRETAFLTFWRGINAALAQTGRAPIALGAAARLWARFAAAGRRL